MTPLDPFGVAVQGVGFDPRIAAVQGLWLFEEDEPAPPSSFPSRRRSPTKKRPHPDDDVLIFLLRPKW